MQKESKLFVNTKDATAKEARALKIGDIIEAVYADSEEARLELVVSTCPTAKIGYWHDIQTLPLDHFGQRSGETNGPYYLNTPKFKKVGSAADIAALLTVELTA